MKKVSIYLMALVGFALVACSSEGGSESNASENTEQTANENQPAAETNTPPPAEAPQAVEPTPEQTQALANPTTLEFDRMEHDFGTVQSGETVNTTFTVKNTGSNPLVISNAKPSCGCTVPQWPKEPIAPGEEGVIEVGFNAKGNGSQNKSVTITANTEPAQTRLVIMANVEGGETAPAQPAN